MAAQNTHRHSSALVWVFPPFRKLPSGSNFYNHNEQSLLIEFHKVFTPSDHKLRITDHCYSLMRSKIGANTLNVSYYCHYSTMKTNRMQTESQPELLYNWRSVGRSVSQSWLWAPGTHDHILIVAKTAAVLFVVGRPLRREDRSVI
jgi:hypothetical protein